MMAEQLSQAVSFANGYFALADGLIADLEKYLAEDVILDWFGQTVKGRNNVAEFMKNQNIKSRHMFSEINATSTIEYRKQRALRRKYHSLGGCENRNLLCSKSDDEDCNIQYKRKYYSDGCKLDDNDNLDDSCNPVTSSDINVEMNFLENKIAECDLQTKQIRHQVSVHDLNLDKLQINSNYTPKAESRKVVDLNSDDVNNALLELGKQLQMNTEIKKTDVNEIEKKMFELRENNIRSHKGFFKTELGQGVAPNIEIKPIKFVEACGVIECSRFANVKQIRKDIRKRQCRLQVAYSVKDDTIDAGKSVENIPKIQSELMSQTRALNDRLLDDKNMNNPDVDEDRRDREQFLKYLELRTLNPDFNVNHLVTPKFVHSNTFYINPEKLFHDSNDNGFQFNYIIHLIIYESNTKCRLNLSHEFESREFFDDLE